jgi:hypothetical protein
MTKATSPSGMTSIHVRLARQELVALDLLNARLNPKFTRPQAIRFALRNQLLQLGLLAAHTNEGTLTNDSQYKIGQKRHRSGRALHNRFTLSE